MLWCSPRSFSSPYEWSCHRPSSDFDTNKTGVKHLCYFCAVKMFICAAVTLKILIKRFPVVIKGHQPSTNHSPTFHLQNQTNLVSISSATFLLLLLWRYWWWPLMTSGKVFINVFKIMEAQTKNLYRTNVWDQFCRIWGSCWGKTSLRSPLLQRHKNCWRKLYLCKICGFSRPTERQPSPCFSCHTPVILENMFQLRRPFIYLGGISESAFCFFKFVFLFKYAFT